MAQTLRVYGIAPDSLTWDKVLVTVHNRAELIDWVEDFHSAGYRLFTVYTDNGRPLVNCSDNVIDWYNVPGFRR